MCSLLSSTKPLFRLITSELSQVETRIGMPMKVMDAEALPALTVSWPFAV